MANLDGGKLFVFDENKVKFNIHSNFCGRASCVYFKKCGQALGYIDKQRLLDDGLVPQIDVHGNISCFKTEEDIEKEIPDSGCKPGTYIPDWPAQELDK